MARSRQNPQDDSTTAEWLASAVGEATRSASFCVAGVLPAVDPELDVNGLGAVKLPLKPATAKRLIACCHAAPYGKGTRTLVDTRVRKTFELNSEEFRLGDPWKLAIDEATRAVAGPLGLPADLLEARLYKLLVYEKGGFFLPHRDSEKHDRMVASLIVALPNRFEGGRLIVRHGAIKQRLAFEDAAAGKASSYAAFYADCEHEVERVTHGIRLCLAYNLVLKSTPNKAASTATPSSATDLLTTALGVRVARQPGKPLIFALEHHYTERGLSLDLLKGADRQLADVLVAATERADCLVHLAQVSRHLSQAAEDGSSDYGYGYRRSSRSGADEIEIGETYEDELKLTEWANLQGAKQPWGEIGFELADIVSRLEIDDWEPTTEEYEGYTGNAGNTLDRWYHRSALVVWHRDHHFEIIADSGTVASIPLFSSMVAQLAKTPKTRLNAARDECIRFAQAIIVRWPRQHRSWSVTTEERSPHDDFPKRLLSLHDRATIALFLAKVPGRDQTLGLSQFVLAVCREFGWGDFAQELMQLIVARPDGPNQAELPVRDLEWLVAFCVDPTADAEKAALARKLCSLAAARFCEPRPTSIYASSRYHRPVSVAEASLALLIKAVVSADCPEELERILQFVEQAPDAFRLGECQVPALKSLIPWARSQFESMLPPLEAWLSRVRRRLEAATDQRPMPPTDWARPAVLSCGCPYCAQLKAFLVDPTNKVGRIAAREDHRQHLIVAIDQHQLDVTHALERRGSPYTLVLTKTTGSFDRSLKQYEVNCQLLSELPTTA